MDTKIYWKKKHKKYSQENWITKPTIFAKFAINYFPKEGKLLELGAGQGQDSRFFAEKGYEVTSTDFSDEALELSRTLAVKNKLGINFQNIDLAQPLPFENNSFDIVYSHLGIHYFNKQRTEELFYEIAKALKAGGILALLLNTLDDPEIKLSKTIEEDLFETPSGLVKRFFSTNSLQNLIQNKFDIIILDNKGKTYKDSIKSLIRFIGLKK